MKDEEKNLIENLFYRLKKTESNSYERDCSADDLIQTLVKKQPASSYYMVQTILIQETAIKKMNMKIEELKKRIDELNVEGINKKSSFLSNFFKKNPASQTTSHDNDIWKKKENFLHSYNSNPTMSPTTQALPTMTPITRSSGFLSNALQTATGVAGGMILGNMLMNVFNHTKPEEEIFDTINKSSVENHMEESSPSNMSHGDLINHEENNRSDVEMNESNLHSISDIHDSDYTDDIDVNDDNFI